jgi:DNA-binding MarR family transcriptional regulator/ribosomal protein S18 acetylase RimI-like enzyme
VPTPPAATLDAVRRFNRLYTRRIGVLQEGLLGSPFSLTEVRVLYELAHRRRTTATDLARELGLDAGYLSRILRGFQRRRLIARTRTPEDARQSLVVLTAAGRQALAPLEEKSRAEVAALLGSVPEASRPRLLAAMGTIEELLGAAPAAEGEGGGGAVVLRGHRPGDVGWVVHRHGVLYSGERGYDATFEALVAQIGADFLRRFDAQGERCWMAERGGAVVGSVFLVRRSKTVAQLRLLLVEPAARGLGVGRMLVEECVRFAGQAGYRKIVLWTQNDLDAARHVYRQAGFRVTEEKKHHSFGHDLVAETWELDLGTKKKALQPKLQGP